MKDYSDIGLDQNLNNQSSLIAGTTTYMTTQDIDTQVEGISASKIVGGNIRTFIDIGHNNPSGTDAYLRLDGTSDRFIFNDGTVNRMFFGNNNGSVAAKLSQANNDVLTATDDQLIWSSDFNMFKIVAMGTKQVVTPAGSANTIGTTAHNQSGTPAFLTYFDFTTNIRANTPQLILSNTGGSLFVNQRFTSYVDGTNIYFQISQDSTTSAGTFNFTYYLLKETAG